MSLCFISAGEVSGDLYASGLLRALKQRCPELQAMGLGGPLLAAEGLVLLDDVRALAAVGLSENLSALPYFHGLLQRLRRWFQQMRPQYVILVDFQGLNLQLAAIAHDLGLTVVYFIAPQDWVWGWHRAAQRLRQSAQLVLAVFEPEARYYHERGVRVLHVGHPLLDLLPDLTQQEARQALGLPLEGFIVCCMPGSRKHEVQRLSIPMRALQAHLGTSYQYLLPMADPVLESPLRGQRMPLSQRYLAMLAADVVVGASGNMVLEAALLGRPVIALYQVSALSAGVAQCLLRRPWVTLPNLLLDGPFVPEYLQDFPIAEMAECLRRAPENMAQWQELRQRLRHLLQPHGAYGRAADAILNLGVAHA